jgi:murein DD-endopeptidase MepM/ murein hydrolase activator NlpD
MTNVTPTGGIWIGVTGFLLGMATTVLIVTSTPRERDPVVIPETPPATTAAASGAIGPAPAPRDCAEIGRRAVTADLRKPPSETDAVAYLRHRTLHLPVAHVTPADLRSSFNERRGASRQHEAIDILAPRNTPVEAVDDGCVARLFESKAGGLTLYQFDPTLTYTYYYAHLERYADELEEGDPVRRGQIIGYVGTSGNAPPNTPHLHFAIFITGVEKRWWEGTPIDPFDVWRPEPAVVPIN